MATRTGELELWKVVSAESRFETASVRAVNGGWVGEDGRALVGCTVGRGGRFPWFFLLGLFGYGEDRF